MDQTPDPYAGTAAAPMARCTYHPETPTSQVCAQCRRPFCDACLVELQSRKLCGECKNVALRDLQRRGTTNREAHDAFITSLVGIVVCGLFLQPYALIKAIRSLPAYRQDPSLTDRWKATTAIVISSVMISIYVIYFGFFLIAQLTYGR